MITDVPETDLKTCPDCGQSLAEPHGECADCGFQYDERTRVWRCGRSWQHRFLYNALAGLAAGLLVTIAYRTAHGAAPNALLPILTGIAVALAGLAFDRLLSGRLSGRFVALTPSGVVLGTRRQRRLVPWSDIHRLNTRGRVPKLELIGDQPDVPLEDVFDTRAELESFRRALGQAPAEPAS
jgi:hypothetical protein